MTWASLEEEQGNPIRAEEIRNLYLQQRTEVVDDASWVMGFSDFIDPAIDSIKRLLNFDQNSSPWAANTKIGRENGNIDESSDQPPVPGKDSIRGSEESTAPRTGDFDLDSFIKDRLSLDASELDAILEQSGQRRIKSSRRIWRSETKTALATP
ncbi:hypothetical protein Taro_012777 [Colocasia esculenta]|uniref:Uncharacterized protein n=1 Tax=Colocasia esculenta TaxID=4460 RepID=A0A843U9Z8_COLES|nr:hypothetical protein [Colocasia esculenta]